MKIVLHGQPITKKNSQEIVLIGPPGKKRPIIVPSRKYKQYEHDCLVQITGDKRLKIDYPVNVRCVYFMQTHQRVDLTNLLEATDDILVAAKVLEDDRSVILHSHDGSRVKYDKRDPRVEIEITEATDADRQMRIEEG